MGDPIDDLWTRAGGGSAPAAEADPIDVLWRASGGLMSEEEGLAEFRRRFPGSAVMDRGVSWRRSLPESDPAHLPTESPLDVAVRSGGLIGEGAKIGSLEAFGQAALNRARDIGGDLLKFPARVGAMATGRDPGVAVPDDLGGEIDDLIKRAMPIGDTVTGDERRQTEASVAAAHPTATGVGRTALDTAAMLAMGSVMPGAGPVAVGAVSGAVLNPEDAGRGALHGAIFMGATSHATRVLGEVLGPGVAKYLAANAGGGTIGSLVTQLASEGHVSPMQAVADGLVVTAFGAAHLKNPEFRAEMRARVAEAAQKGQTLDDVMADAMAEGRRTREAAKGEVPPVDAPLERPSQEAVSRPVEAAVAPEATREAIEARKPVLDVPGEAETASTGPVETKGKSVSGALGDVKTGDSLDAYLARRGVKDRDDPMRGRYYTTEGTDAAWNEGAGGAIYEGAKRRERVRLDNVLVLGKPGGAGADAYALDFLNDAAKEGNRRADLILQKTPDASGRRPLKPVDLPVVERVVASIAREKGYDGIINHDFQEVIDLTRGGPKRAEQARANAAPPSRDVSQAGSVPAPSAGPTVPKRSLWRDFTDAVRQRGFQNIFRTNPTAQQHAWGAAAADTYGDTLSRTTTKRVEAALPRDIPRETFDQALLERTHRWTHEQNVARSTDPRLTPEERQDYADAAARGPQTLVGKPGSAFATEADYEKFWNDPRKDRALKAVADVVNQRATPDYKTATGDKASALYPTDPVLGFHYSLNPHSEARIAESKSRTLFGDAGRVEGGGDSGGAGGGSGLLRRPRTARARTGGSFAYESDLTANLRNQFSASREAAEKIRMYDALVESGDASYKPVQELRGEPTTPIDVRKVGGPRGEGTTLYVRRSLVPEVERVAKSRHEDVDLAARATGLMTGVNVAINPAELMSHIGGAAKGIASAPSDTGLPTVVEAGIKAVAGPVWDAVKVKRAVDVIRNLDTKHVGELERLATDVPGVLRRVPDSVNFGNATTAFIHRVWNGLAVYLNRVYDVQVRKGAVDTPEARRRFILGILGNYNWAASGPFMRGLRKYINPFAVPQVARSTRGVLALTGDTGVEMKTTGGAIKQRILGLSNLVAPIVMSHVAWWALYGKPPPKDVPIGGAPVPGLGEKDERGGTRYIDLFDLGTVGRGMKAVGAESYLRLKGQGEGEDAALGGAFRQAATRIGGTLSSGPLVNLVSSVVTGDDAIGRPLRPKMSKEENQRITDYIENALYSIGETNPIAGAVMEGAGAIQRRSDRDSSFQRMIPFVKSGIGEDVTDRMPRIRAIQDVKEWRADASRRLLKARGTDDFPKVQEQIRREAEEMRRRVAR